MKVEDMSSEFSLVQDAREITHILDAIGAPPEDYEFGCLFVETEDGDYGRIYGVSTYTPWLGQDVRDVREWYSIG